MRFGYGRATFALGLSMLASASSFAAEYKILHIGTLLSDARNKPLAEQSMVIRDKIIQSVEGGYVTADTLSREEGDTVETIDLKDKFVMAGLIDAHMHMASVPDRKNSRTDVVYKSLAERAVMAVPAVRMKLLAGYTTVRDLGGSRDIVVALRDGIKGGFITGPRILTATNTVSPTGGHGDANGFKPGLVQSNSSICDGVGDCRRAVRQAVKNGADVIKYVATGGVMSNIAAGTGQQFSQAEQNVIVQTAHSMGRKVAAHAHGTDGINAALRAGADSIEHGTYLDKESIKLFKKTGAYLVPTLTVANWAAEKGNEEGFFPPAVAAKARRVGPQTIKGLARAYKAGVKIALGSDFSGENHQASKKEMLLMVKAGMSEKDVLIAGTIHGADLLGLSNQIGTLEAGKSADLVAYGDNPLKNIDTMLEPLLVMLQGKVAN